MRVTLQLKLMVLLFFWVSVHSSTLCAQPYKPCNISLSQGLAQSVVYKIVQDRQGFVWMATQDGLNRYDGTGFKIFRENPFDTTTLSSNFITALFIDHRGWLWVGTQNHGLNLFVPGSDKFRHFFANGDHTISHNGINDIYEDSRHNLWIATVRGLDLLTLKGDDPATATASIKKINLKSVTAKEQEPVAYKVFTDKKNNVWAGTKDGLFRMAFTDADLSKIDLYNEENGALAGSNDIRAIAQDATGKLWIGSSFGLHVYNEDSGKFVTVFKIYPELEAQFKTGQLSDLFSDSFGNMWIGTNGGGLFELKNENVKKPMTEWKFESVKLGKERSASYILAIAEDKINPGLMWIGTFAEGAYKLVPVLKNFYSDHLEFENMETPLVTCLMKDNDGLVWLGTQNGLVKQNKATHTYEVYKYNNKPGASLANYITSVLQDREGKIWVASDDGVSHFVLTNGKADFIRYSTDKEYDQKAIRTLYLDDKNNVYVIYRSAVFRYDRKEDVFKKYTENLDSTDLQRGYSFSCMLIDRQNQCWLGSTMGLVVYRHHIGEEIDFTKPEVFYHQLRDTNTLRSQNIQSLMQDSKGNIWIGTTNGLTRANVSDNKIVFTNYSSANGIKNNFVYAAVEDPQTGFLWLSTNGGLTRFDPAGKATMNFDINDGLQSNEFNAGAYSRADDGELFFGGIQGYTSFYPSQIKLDTVAPRVYLTDFVIPGKPQAFIFDATSNKSVTLKYAENSFTIDFIALHYNDPAKNQYAYKLEGFQQDWTYCGTSHQVNFSHVPPGEYTFRVKAANNDGYFSPVDDTLTIVIKPPFYKTIWFYLLLLAFVAGVLWLLHIYRLKMKLTQIKEVERIRKETAADFHDELGHRLTTISWFSEILKKKLKPEQVELRSHLDKIIETSGNLYLTMKDLLWAMDPEKDSVYHMYAQLKNFGEELFDHTGVEFHTNGVQDELKSYDLPLSYKRHILLIFKEIMHNSLKHGDASATFLDLERTNGSLILRFGDDGKGFDPANESLNGNGMKNVRRRAEIIHAETNIKSNGTGTSFELKIHLN